jgi:hypothetical protein
MKALILFLLLAGCCSVAQIDMQRSAPLIDNFAKEQPK